MLKPSAKPETWTYARGPPPQEYADGENWTRVRGIHEIRRGYFSGMCSLGALEYGDTFFTDHYSDRPAKRSSYGEIYSSGSRYFIRNDDGSTRLIEFTFDRDLIIVGQWFANGEPFPGSHGNIIPRCSADEVFAYDPEAYRKPYRGKVKSMVESHCEVLASQVAGISTYRQSGAPIEAAYSFADPAGDSDASVRRFMYQTVKVIYQGYDLSAAVSDGRWVKACIKATAR